MLKFAYVNKTYINDLEYSKALYLSWKKHYSGSSPFFIVCPEKDLKAFREVLPSANIIAEEEIVLKAGLDLAEYKKLNGWYGQQVIKMVFYEYTAIENYMTIDSDVLFTEAFSDDIFFENNTLKTVCFNYKPKNTSGMKVINDVYKKADPTYNVSDSLYFVMCYTLWNVGILQKLNNFIKQNGFQNFIDIINFSPWEGAWYGRYLYFFHRDLFIAQKPVFSKVMGSIAYGNLGTYYKSRFVIYYEYKINSRRNFIGCCLQFTPGDRNGTTLDTIIEEYGKIKVSLIVKRIVYLFSNFISNKIKRAKFRDWAICKYYGQ